MIERQLFLHAETDKAVLVSPTPLHANAERDGAWLPKSMIEVVGKCAVANPRFGEHPAIAQILGTVLTFRAPADILAERKLDRDAEL